MEGSPGSLFADLGDPDDSGGTRLFERVLPAEALALVRRVRRFQAVRADELLVFPEEFAVIVDAPRGAANPERILDAVRQMDEVVEIGERMTSTLPNGGTRVGAAFQVIMPVGGATIVLAIQEALSGARAGTYGLAIIRADYAAAWSAVPEFLDLAVASAVDTPSGAIRDWLQRQLEEFLRRAGVPSLFGSNLTIPLLLVGGGVVLFLAVK